jgi:hypothetical protein
LLTDQSTATVAVGEAAGSCRWKVSRQRPIQLCGRGEEGRPEGEKKEGQGDELRRRKAFDGSGKRILAR